MRVARIPPSIAPLRRDGLAIRGLPAPRARAIAALGDALLVDLRDNLALAGLAVIDGDDAAAVDAPRHLVLVFASGDAGVALDATIGVAEEFHTGHGRCSFKPL